MYWESLLGVRRLWPHEGLGRGHGARVPLGDGDGGAVLLEPLVRVLLVVLEQKDAQQIQGGAEMPKCGEILKNNQ